MQFKLRQPTEGFRRTYLQSMADARHDARNMCAWHGVENAIAHAQHFCEVNKSWYERLVLRCVQDCMDTDPDQLYAESVQALYAFHRKPERRIDPSDYHEINDPLTAEEETEAEEAVTYIIENLEVAKDLFGKGKKDAAYAVTHLCRERYSSCHYNIKRIERGVYLLDRIKQLENTFAGIKRW